MRRAREGCTYEHPTRVRVSEGQGKDCGEGWEGFWWVGKRWRGREGTQTGGSRTVVGTPAVDLARASERDAAGVDNCIQTHSQHTGVTICVFDHFGGQLSSPVFPCVPFPELVKAVRVAVLNFVCFVFDCVPLTIPTRLCRVLFGLQWWNFIYVYNRIQLLNLLLHILSLQCLQVIKKDQRSEEATSFCSEEEPCRSTEIRCAPYY